MPQHVRSLHSQRAKHNTQPWGRGGECRPHAFLPVSPAAFVLLARSKSMAPLMAAFTWSMWGPMLAAGFYPAFHVHLMGVHLLWCRHSSIICGTKYESLSQRFFFFSVVYDISCRVL